MFIIVRSEKKWKKRKKKARAEVSKAIRTGKLTRPAECSKCEEERKILGHHKDYDLPLDVEWLCYRCHSEIHRAGFVSLDRQRELNREAADRWHDRPHGRYRERFGDHAVPSPT